LLLREVFLGEGRDKEGKQQKEGEGLKRRAKVFTHSLGDFI